MRDDRRREFVEKTGYAAHGDVRKAIAEMRPDALIISVPPDVHHVYMKLAVEYGIHFFVEASVTDTDMEQIARDAEKKGIVAAPSATLRFHPGIQTITSLVREGRLGKVSNVLYHCGQYLPDWHTYERVKDYYVSNPVTGGAREIVPFELTWLVDIFGLPTKAYANVRKTIHIEGAEKIDDTYNCLLDYGDSLLTMTVDVVSRFATRRLVINGDKAQLVWDWNRPNIEIYNPVAKTWDAIPYQMGKAAPGYNANIGENMYIDELRQFIGATAGQEKFCNTLKDDGAVLRLLYTMEQSDRDGRALRVPRA
jgi:predicted dehydrogenase